MTSIKKIVINSPGEQKVYGIEDSEVRQEVQDILGGAPEELDSFLEAFEKFKEGNEVLAGLEAGVKSNATAIADEATRAKEAEKKLDKRIDDIPLATTEYSGLMSAEDKVELGEIRNFLDRLMAGLGVSDATVVADRIVAAILSKETPTVKAQVDGYNLILEGDVDAADDNLTLGGDNISIEERDNGMFNLNIN